MATRTAAAVVAGYLLSMSVVMAQTTPPARGGSAAPDQASMMVLMGPRGPVPITQRLAPTTLHGTIIELSCFRTMGAGTVAGAEQLACAKAAITKGSGNAGILTDGVGTFQLAGSFTANNYAKLLSYLGKEVDTAGSEVYVSNNFSYHVFEATKITPAKNGVKGNSP